VRILVVSTAFPRTRDDPTVKWLAETLRRLAAEGYEIEVLTSAYRGGGNTSLDGIPIHRFRYFFARWERLTHEESAPDRMRRSPFYAVLPIFYLACGAVAAWRLARRRHYDIVHVHWPVPHAVFGWAARAGGTRRMIAQFYSIELRWVRHSLPFLRGFLRRAVTSANYVVAISTSTAREVQAVAPVPVDIIPYAVDLPDDTTAGGASARRSAREPGQPFTVLSVGRLVERKGVLYLIDAIAAMRDTLDARAVIIGDGPERAALEAQADAAGISDRIEFRGWVSPDELHEAYASASAFALPAVIDHRGDTEGLGMVLLEAMTYGVPVVSTPMGGIPDIVQHDRTGLLVPPNDASALAAALIALATDGALVERLTIAAHTSARESFGWPGVLAKWRAMYARVMAGLPAPDARSLTELPPSAPPHRR
jgi:glycosyltransferase involved in cell wall biosynthesis